MRRLRYLGGKHLEELSEHELERLLVERWLYQGALMLMVGTFAVVAAIVVQRQGIGALTQGIGWIMAGLAVVTFFVFEWMRAGSRRIAAELRRRRG